VVTGRHAGQNTGRPDYAYTGRHAAPAAPSCPVVATVTSPNGDGKGLLICNRRAHDDPQHYDEAEGIAWQVHGYSPAGQLPDLAGAVA
jgi:hypothetical protein